MSDVELMALTTLAFAEVVVAWAENMNREHLGQAMAYTNPPFGMYHAALMLEMETRVLPSRTQEVDMSDKAPVEGTSGGEAV